MIEKNKRYTTVSGKRVRILDTKRLHHRYPVIALVGEGTSLEALKSYTADGLVSSDQDPSYDLALPRMTRRNPSLARYIDGIERNLKALKRSVDNR
jgi:hypothetical protein